MAAKIGIIVVLLIDCGTLTRKTDTQTTAATQATVDHHFAEVESRADSFHEAVTTKRETKRTTTNPTTGVIVTEEIAEEIVDAAIALEQASATTTVANAAQTVTKTATSTTTKTITKPWWQHGVWLIGALLLAACGMWLWRRFRATVVL